MVLSSGSPAFTDANAAFSKVVGSFFYLTEYPCGNPRHALFLISFGYGFKHFFVTAISRHDSSARYTFSFTGGNSRSAGN
jgi:hypothetical protein